MNVKQHFGATTFALSSAASGVIGVVSLVEGVTPLALVAFVLSGVLAFATWWKTDVDRKLDKDHYWP